MLLKLTFDITLMLLLLGKSSCQQNRKACLDYYFPLDGTCQRCPEGCKDCISDLNCTICKGSLYGPVCQYNCLEECTTVCQKVYGYCTHDCPDGYYPIPGSGDCPKCPANCTLCKSNTECVECFPGLYGNKCEHICAKYCETCNKATGACLVCDERYFNQNGYCHKCPNYCLRCYDSKGCSRCEEGYVKLIDGQCIMECVEEEKAAAITITPDQDGYSIEYTTLQGCTNKEHSQVLELRTGEPCIQYSPCSSNSMCSQFDGKSACGATMINRCRYLCHLANKSYTCAYICTIAQQKTSAVQFCLMDIAAVNDTMVETYFECASESDDLPTCKVSIALSVLFGLLSLSMTVYITWTSRKNIRKWYHTCLKRRGGVDMEKDSVREKQVFQLESQRIGVNLRKKRHVPQSQRRVKCRTWAGDGCEQFSGNKRRPSQVMPQEWCQKSDETEDQHHTPAGDDRNMQYQEYSFIQ